MELLGTIVELSGSVKMLYSLFKRKGMCENRDPQRVPSVPGILGPFTSKSVEARRHATPKCNLYIWSVKEWSVILEIGGTLNKYLRKIMSGKTTSFLNGKSACLRWRRPYHEQQCSEDLSHSKLQCYELLGS